MKLFDKELKELKELKESSYQKCVEEISSFKPIKGNDTLDTYQKIFQVIEEKEKGWCSWWSEDDVKLILCTPALFEKILQQGDPIYSIYSRLKDYPQLADVIFHHSRFIEVLEEKPYSNFECILSVMKRHPSVFYSMLGSEMMIPCFAFNAFTYRFEVLRFLEIECGIDVLKLKKDIWNCFDEYELGDAIFEMSCVLCDFLDELREKLSNESEPMRVKGLKTLCPG